MHPPAMRPVRSPETEWDNLAPSDSFGVATRPQLERLGLYKVAVKRQAQQIKLDLTLHGQGSTRPLDCVALTPNTDLTTLSSRVIGHEVAATELMERWRASSGYQWHRAVHLGSGRDTVPDWWLWDQGKQQIAAMVEIDLGYPNARLDAKLAGAVSGDGPPVGYILGTTLKGRVEPFIERAAALAADLPRLAWVDCLWLDVESATHRYGPQRRGIKQDFASWERSPGARPPGAESQTG